MVPAAYVRLDALPLSPNGKLDRARPCAAPPGQGQAYAVSAYEPPQGPVEETLAAIWADVLGVEQVGRHDNFFDLGGHSLLAVRVASRIRKEMGVGAALMELLESPCQAHRCSPFTSTGVRRVLRRRVRRQSL